MLDKNTFFKESSKEKDKETEEDDGHQVLPLDRALNYLINDKLK